MIDVGNDRKITNKILILHKFLFYDDAGSNLIDFICQTFAVLKTAKVSEVDTHSIPTKASVARLILILTTSSSEERA